MVSHWEPEYNNSYSEDMSSATNLQTECSLVNDIYNCAAVGSNLCVVMIKLMIKENASIESVQGEEVRHIAQAVTCLEKSLYCTSAIVYMV